MQGWRNAIFNRVGRVGVIGQVTLEQRQEGGEG